MRGVDATWLVPGATSAEGLMAFGGDTPGRLAGGIGGGNHPAKTRKAREAILKELTPLRIGIVRQWLGEEQEDLQWIDDVRKGRALLEGLDLFGAERLGAAAWTTLGHDLPDGLLCPHKHGNPLLNSMCGKIIISASGMWCVAQLSFGWAWLWQGLVERARCCPSAA